MIINAILLNPDKPGMQPVDATFPIEDHEDLYRRLSGSGIGDAVRRDCRVADIGGAFEALLLLKGQNVNVDELDYLAKRIESFFEPEVRQFEGTAAAMSVTDVPSLINLTFCCQQATVISDFSDLRVIGKEHYMNTHGGGAPVSVIEALDSERIARELIENETGIATPHGVVYSNSMEIEQLYRGRGFPAYLHDQCLMAVEVTNDSAPDIGSTWLYMPMPEECLERMLERGGLGDPSDISRLDIEAAGLSADVFSLIDTASETPKTLNDAAVAISKLSKDDLVKFHAAVEYVEPYSASVLREIARQLDLFDFYPTVSDAAEYGRYMIAESGHFEYDPELDDYYDFEGYGEMRLQNEEGTFLDRGYISYRGEAPMETVFSEQEMPPGQGMAMGGA